MKRVSVALLCVFASTFVLLLNGCATSTRSASYTNHGVADDGKAQKIEEDLLSFETHFIETLRDANRGLENSPESRVWRQALANRLVYSSSALEIALGTYPENNLLDMVALIELSRDALRSYWIPNFFGPGAEPVLAAFNQAQDELERISARVLEPSQRTELHRWIEAWRDKHPHQIAVETVRLFHAPEEQLSEQRESFRSDEAPFRFRIRPELRIFKRSRRLDPATLATLESLRALLAQANTVLQNTHRHPHLAEASNRMLASLTSLSETTLLLEEAPPDHSRTERLTDQMNRKIQVLLQSAFFAGGALLILGFFLSIFSKLLSDLVSEIVLRRWARAVETEQHEDVYGDKAA